MSVLTRALSGPSWPIVLILSSLIILAGAHAFEILGDLPPCSLCLRQRDIYWSAIMMGVVGLALWQHKPSDRFLVALNIMLALVFTTSLVVAAYHAGVEWKFWQGPSGCSATGLSNFEDIDLLASLDTPKTVIACDEAPWRLFGVSMAGYNALLSFALALSSFIAAAHTFSAARQASKDV